MKRFCVIAVVAANLLMPGAYAAADAKGEVLFYRNPMNPAITSPVPAKDNMGMDYIPVYADETGQGATVNIDPAVVQNLGVRTEVVTRGRLSRRIDTVGYVGYNERNIGHVHMRADGWIERLVVKSVGERVKAGDLLFEIYAPTLANAQEEFLQSLRVGQSGLISASRERLRALGIDTQQISKLESSRKALPRIQVYAQQDGVVAELNVREGMFVKPGTVVMSLADLSSVWLQADVFERQADWVKVGQVSEVRLDYRPGEVFKGKVDFVYPTLDQKTRALRVRLRFDNPDELFKPQMYANVLIFTDPRDNVLSVPLEALIRTGTANRIILAEGEGKFRAVEVVPGMETGDRVEIKEGLVDGARVVVSGQFLIDSEASIRATALRMQNKSPAEQPMTEAEPITGAGTVTAIMADHRMLTLDHDPIEVLGWPAMSMDFNLTDKPELEGIKPGSRIHFTLVQDKDDMYRIDSIHVME